MITIRRATIDDLNNLIQLRTALFQEMGILSEKSDEKSFQKACHDYFSQFIASKEFLSWVAENNGKIIATSGLVFLQKPPDPRNNTGKEAYIMNMFTLPEWRNQGIATKLMEETIAFIKKKGINLLRLHTTEIARSTYEKIGCIQVDYEMEIRGNFSVSE